jgi:hypothetical protein
MPSGTVGDVVSEYTAAVSSVNAAISSLNSIANTTISMSIHSTALPTGYDYSAPITAIGAIAESSAATPGTLAAAGTVTPAGALTTTDIAANGQLDPALLAAAQVLTMTSTAATALNAVSFDLGALPTAPDLSTFNTPKWSETYWTNLKSTMDGYMTGLLGATDVDNVITSLTNDSTKMQVAFYAQDRERKQQALRDAHSAAAASVGARGFTYPNSMTTALKLAATQQYQFDLSQVSRELVKHIYDWAKTNYQFTIDKSISAHNSDTEWNARYADVLIKSFSAQLDSIFQQAKLRLEYALQRLDANIKLNQLTIDSILRKYVAITDTEIKKYTAQVDANIKTFDAQSNANINTFTASSSAIISSSNTNADIKYKYYSLLIEKAKTIVSQLSEEDKNALIEYSAAVQEHVSLANNQVKVISDNAVKQVNAASAAAQAAASLANAASQTAIAIQQIA